jgi:hypothetical protein
MMLDEPDDPRHEDTSFSRSGAGKHEQGAFEMFHRLALRGVEPRASGGVRQDLHQRSIISKTAPGSSEGTSRSLPS